MTVCETSPGSSSNPFRSNPDEKPPVESFSAGNPRVARNGAGILCPLSRRKTEFVIRGGTFLAGCRPQAPVSLKATAIPKPEKHRDKQRSPRIGDTHGGGVESRHATKSVKSGRNGLRNRDAGWRHVSQQETTEHPRAADMPKSTTEDCRSHSRSSARPAVSISSQHPQGSNFP